MGTDISSHSDEQLVSLRPTVAKNKVDSNATVSTGSQSGQIEIGLGQASGALRDRENLQRGKGKNRRGKNCQMVREKESWNKFIGAMASEDELRSVAKESLHKSQRAEDWQVFGKKLGFICKNLEDRETRATGQVDEVSTRLGDDNNTV